MTLKRRYDEVMDRVEVTEEMRRRILGNLREMDIPANGRAVRFPNIRRSLSAAACLVILLAGVFAAGRLAGAPSHEGSYTADGNGIVEMESRERLSAAVGFEVEELETLPFTVEETVYRSYWNELAEITYSGEGRTAEFRKSPGTGDNSGDYNVYPDVREVRHGTLTATLKGSGEVYTLAVWSADGYAYSIRLSGGLSESEWYDLLWN